MPQRRPVGQGASASPLLARLDESRRRVLCGWGLASRLATCGGVIGEVWKWVSLRFLAIGPGFLQGPDGVWRMTRHARRRRDPKGLPPALHKPLVSHPYNPGVTPYQTPRTLPARAACPKCGLSQVLNPVTLDVGIAPEHILMVPGLTYLAMFVEPDEPLDIGVPGP